MSNKTVNYRMRLKDIDRGVRYGGLMFESYIEDDDSSALSNPIFRDAIGDHIEYGSLFAYLFRRFGYPNTGWDDYKELAQYHLSTPCKDMTLQVTPFAGNDSVITFTFLVPLETLRKFDAYSGRKHAAWKERFFCWHEKNITMPKWMKGFIKELMESSHGKGDETTWRDVYDFIPRLKFMKIETEQDEIDKQTVTAWYSSINEVYKDVEEEPLFHEMFTKNWRDLSDDNPLKPYAFGAYETLIQLKKPVSIRDAQINAMGALDRNASTRSLKHAVVAGYPLGALGNNDPKGFAELHNRLLKLGGGNAKQGIKKMISILDREVKAGQPL